MTRWRGPNDACPAWHINRISVIFSSLFPLPHCREGGLDEGKVNSGGGAIFTAKSFQPRHALMGSWSSVLCTHTATYLIVKYGLNHRRRIKTEEKAKVAAVVWGTELIQYLAALDIFHYRMIWRKEWIEEWLLGEMDALKKLMIIRFTPYQTITLPKLMFSQ